ncbi:MAG: acyl-CoA thioesterase [Candidatus Levyibacteriota bacterium]
MSRLVETRGIQPLESTPGETFKIRRELIDGYNHVNHAAYIRLFEESRHMLGLARNMHVSRISVTYDDQFRQGDTAKIEAHVFERNDGLLVVGQEMRKPGSERMVRQSTRLLAGNSSEPVPEEFSPFNPRNHPLIADLASPIKLPRPDSTEYHTVFAPLFEAERAKVIQKQGVSVKQLAQEFAIRTVVVHLDAYYTGRTIPGEVALALTRGHLDMRSRGGYASMLFQQSMVGQDEIPLAIQQTRYLFIDNNENRVNLPPEAEALITG